jgi:curved DNA-binding protein CbpA
MKLNATLLRQDLYRVLGVPKGASRDEIRRRYRHLVRVSHPDRNPRDQRSAALRMAEINVAAAVLLDPQRRAEYDRHRRLEAETRTRGATPGARASGRSGGRETQGFTAPVCDAWETRRARRGLGRDQLRVLKRLRPWAARQLEALSLWHAERPARSQLAFLVATITLAFFLIGAARPRPIWDPPNRVTKGTAPATCSG